MTNKEIVTKGASRLDEVEARQNMVELLRDCPVPDNELLRNLGLYLNRQTLSRILFMHELYQKIINVHGVIMEFGVRWGQNLALFESFRGIYEPFNHNRKIIGFDTFAGFPSTHEKDGNSDIIKEGAYSVTNRYEDYLTKLLEYHESESPIPHIKKFELVKGDATITIHEYLERHPETVIAFAYFDFDIYEPTKKCLEAIKKHLTKGCIIGFDELNLFDYPGETVAFQEVLGINNFKIQRMPYSPTTSFITFE